MSGGGPSGTNLDSPALVGTLFPKVAAWLVEESKGIAAPLADAGQFIGAFAPIIGFNAVYLDALGDEFKGMAVTFNAAELTTDTLQITELEVQPDLDRRRPPRASALRRLSRRRSAGSGSRRQLLQRRSIVRRRSNR